MYFLPISSLIYMLQIKTAKQSITNAGYIMNHVFNQMCYAQTHLILPDAFNNCLERNSLFLNIFVI